MTNTTVNLGRKSQVQLLIEFDVGSLFHPVVLMLLNVQ
jgi:hypothetical protein